MILKKEEKEINYLENWPMYFYELTAPTKRKEVLLKAIDLQLNPRLDGLRLTILEKRYCFKNNKEDSIDSFLHAWMMIKASSAAGVIKFQVPYKQKKLKLLMEELGILNYLVLPVMEQELLIQEWVSFAKFYITSCSQDRTYCSTLFRIIPIKDETVAEKLADEIDQVTRRYPKLLHLEDFFLPFRKTVSTVFCQMIENGEKYWTDII